MSKAEPAQKRLQELIAKQRQWAGKGNPEHKRRLAKSETYWSWFARSALTLEEGDSPLRRAFSAFTLDPDDPSDWARLAHLMAAALFPNKARPGRPRSWDFKQYCELLDALDLRKQQNPRVSDRRACELIVDDVSSRPYLRDAGVDGLIKALRKARSPDHNYAWLRLLDLRGGRRNVDSEAYEELRQIMANDLSAATERLLSIWRERKAKAVTEQPTAPSRGRKK